MKRLSFRFVRRAFLILALLFPIVYLCGSLFFTLNGSHGTQLLGETDETYLVVDRGSFVNGMGIDADGNTYSDSRFATSPFYPVSSDSYGLFVNAVYDTAGTSQFHVVFFDFEKSFVTRRVYNGGTAIPTASFSLDNEGFVRFCIYSITSNTSSYINFDSIRIYSNNLSWLSYSDYLFSKPFASNNFITDLGQGVIDQSAPGFEPFRDMLFWFNDNMLGVAVDDGLGCFGIGYCYYALNVVAIYELVVLVVMIFTLPLKLTDRFTKEM